MRGPECGGFGPNAGLQARSWTKIRAIVMARGEESDRARPGAPGWLWGSDLEGGPEIATDGVVNSAVKRAFLFAGARRAHPLSTELTPPSVATTRAPPAAVL